MTPSEFRAKHQPPSKVDDVPKPVAAAKSKATPAAPAHAPAQEYAEPVTEAQPRTVAPPELMEQEPNTSDPQRPEPDNIASGMYAAGVGAKDALLDKVRKLYESRLNAPRTPMGPSNPLTPR